MSAPNDDRPQLTREEQGFVERVDASYAPAPMRAAERVAFDQALAERIQASRPARRWLAVAWLPAAAAAALAAVWLFSARPGSDGLAPSESGVPALSTRASGRWLSLSAGPACPSW